MYTQDHARAWPLTWSSLSSSHVVTLIVTLMLAVGCGEVVPRGQADASTRIDGANLAMCGDGQLDPGEQCDGPVGENAVCDACALVCLDTFDNCTNDDSLACLTDTSNDPDHCGGCNIACPGTQCINGQCQTTTMSKTVFLSSQVLYGDFGSVYEADNLCQEMAAQADLNGEFRAWISSQEASVRERFEPFDGPYLLVASTIIADGWDDLTDGTLSQPIRLTEYGQNAEPWSGGECHGGIRCEQVFTATTPSGDYTPGENADCNNWSGTATLPGFTGGDSKKENEEWTLRASGFRCDYAARLYCFEQ